MNKSDNLKEIQEEIKSILTDFVNPITEVIEIEDEEIAKMDGQAKLESEMSDYISDDEEMDKWDNVQKACWTGYTQVGTKEKNGKQVPNCVPIEKVEDLSEADLVTKSLWGGKFSPNNR